MPAAETSEREAKPHDCEHCGKHMQYADQTCGCTAKSNRIGYAGVE